MACLCGHEAEDHQGPDGLGEGPDCSIWDCLCPAFEDEEV